MTKKNAGSKKAKRNGSKKGPYTHVDRSNGQYLRESELDKNKPHISPISNTASVEKMTDEEAEQANA